MPIAALLMATLATTQQSVTRPGMQPPSVDFTGLPQVLWSGRYLIESSNVRVTLNPVGVPKTRLGTYRTEITTLIKTLDKPFPGRVLIPRKRWGDANSGNPGWLVKLTVDGKATPLRPVSERGKVIVRDGNLSEYSSDLAYDMRFEPRRTYVLRTLVDLPIGTAGYEGKQQIVAVWAGGEIPVGQFQLSYAYDQNTVFGLPKIGMGMGISADKDQAPAQIGSNGTFIPFKDLKLPNDALTLRYYPVSLNR